MTTAPHTSHHPLGEAIAEAGEVLLEALEVPLFGLGVIEMRELCRQATMLEWRLAAVQAAILAQADHDQVGADCGATSTANWLADRLRLTRTEAHRKMRLAKDLQERPQVASALVEGKVRVEQARVGGHPRRPRGRPGPGPGAGR